MNKEQYENDLKKRQAEHLKSVAKHKKDVEAAWIPCLHDNCPECVGTGVKKNGNPCVHAISCPCPKCSPHY